MNLNPYKQNKHIIFDDDDDVIECIEEHDYAECGKDDSYKHDENLNKSTSNNLASSNHTGIKVLNVTLTKNLLKKEKSFGFHLKGDTNTDTHYINFVEENTAAHRAGLKPFDKVVNVNGVCVKYYKTSQLIEHISYETSLNSFKINLVIERKENENGGIANNLVKKMGANASSYNDENEIVNNSNFYKDDDDDDESNGYSSFFNSNDLLKRTFCKYFFLIYITWWLSKTWEDYCETRFFEWVLC